MNPFFPPAPNLTNSYSFNDKIDFARGKHAKILAIGSSMTLNNLDSKVIVDEFNTTSYLNLASWGMSMGDIFTTLKAYTENNMPEKLIISSTIGDFSVEDKSLDQDLLSDVFSSADFNYFFYYFHDFNFKYLAENYKYVKKVKQDSTSYEYLKYDDFGAVLLNPKYLEVSQQRWNAPVAQFPNEKQYHFLDSIAAWCERNNVELFFFQSPVRVGMFNDSKNPVNKSKLSKHANRIRSMFAGKRHHFCDAGKVEWNDSLFADNLHFFDFGAKQFTTYCINEVNAATDKRK